MPPRVEGWVWFSDFHGFGMRDLSPSIGSAFLGANMQQLVWVHRPATSDLSPVHRLSMYAGCTYTGFLQEWHCAVPHYYPARGAGVSSFYYVQCFVWADQCAPRKWR